MFNEPLIADGVASVLGVLAAIDLDDEPFLSTNKIDDITPNRLLTHKFEIRRVTANGGVAKVFVRRALSSSAIALPNSLLLP